MADDILDLGAWVILRMASADTLKVAKALSGAGFDVWTPVEKRLGRMPRTRAQFDKEFALMPSYVFASVHHVRALTSLAVIPDRDTPRFTMFRYQGCIPLIADDQLNALRAEEDRTARVYEKAKNRGRKGPSFGKGTTVRVPEGPFAGLSGIVEDTQGNCTLVSIDGFHAPIKISSLLLQSDVAGEDCPEVGLAA